MHPDLISIGFLHIKTYGACMALGFLAAWQVLSWLCRRGGRNPEPYTNLVMLMMVAGVVGSRAAYVIEHWQAEFAANLWQIVRVDQGGLMFYGGLVLAVACFFIWCFVKREKVLPLADLFVVVIPLGHAFGRVGCFFYGCCYGRESDCPLAVAFPHHSPAWFEQFHAGKIAESAQSALPVLPTQLFEAAAVMVLFLALFALYRALKGARPGLVTGAYLAGYACIRFMIEILRGDPRAQVGVFSIGQSISLVLLLAGISLICIAFFRKKL